jgi:hypothetical protein
MAKIPPWVLAIFVPNHDTPRGRDCAYCAQRDRLADSGTPTAK